MRDKYEIVGMRSREFVDGCILHLLGRGLGLESLDDCTFINRLIIAYIIFYLLLCRRRGLWLSIIELDLQCQ